MNTPEGFPATPFLYRDEELKDYIGTLYADVNTIADLPAKYGVTLDEIGVEAICFSTYDTEYDPDTGVLTLGVLAEDAPPNVVNSPRQHRSTLAHRSVPASSRPQEYFARRSEELSRTLASMVLERAVAAGYESPQAKNLRSGHNLALALGSALTVAAIVGIVNAAASSQDVLDSPVEGVAAIGGGMTAGGVGFVALIYFFGVWETYGKYSRALQALTTDEMSEAYQNAPADLIRITPPSLPRPDHSVFRRHPNSKRSWRLRGLRHLRHM